MDSERFRYDETYLDLKQEAHRRGASECIAPSVMWHLGVWPSAECDPQSASTENEFNIRLEEWITGGINGFLRRVQHPDLLIPKGSKPLFFGVNKRGDGTGKHKIWSSAQSAIEFDLMWRGLRIQVKVEIHTDYATITFLTNLDDGQTHPYKTRIEGALRDIGTTPEAAKAAAVMLYDTVWDDFAAGITALSEESGVEKGPFHPGEIFASLRGAAPLMKPNGGGLLSYIPQAAGQYIPEAIIDKLSPAEDEKFNSANARATLKAHEYFLTPFGFQHDDREFVACLMMNCQALFVSALGAVPERQRDLSEAEPAHHTRYAIFTTGDPNARQFGRLVELINTLGVLQIMAIKDLDEIREVGTQIRLTGDRLDGMSRDFHEAIGNNKTDVRRLELQLCQLEAELDAMSEGPVGGLQYRVARSRYYAGQFESRIKDLKATAIDRWQTYDMFARRRLIPVFNYIGSVGQRMINLRQRLHTILESVQTKTLVDVNENLLTIQTSQNLQTGILFVIAVAAFFGEVMEPGLKMGGTLAGLLHYIVWPLGAFSACDAGTLKESASNLSGITQGDAIQHLQAAKETCGALYKFAAYTEGMLFALVIVALYSLFSLLMGKGKARKQKA